MPRRFLAYALAESYCVRCALCQSHAGSQGPVVVSDVRADGQPIVWANDEFVALTGYPREVGRCTERPDTLTGLT